MPVTRSPGSPQAAGVQDQLEKVSTTPNTQTGVSGPHNQHNSHDTNLTRRKGAEDPEGMPVDSSQGHSVSEGLVETDWNDDGDDTGGLASSTTLQRAPGLEDTNIEDTQSFHTMVLFLNKESKAELEWRIEILNQWNDRPSLPLTPDLIIDTDGSLLSWGAATEQMSTGGHWSEEERTHHIYLLEQAGGALVTKTFTKGRKNIHVLLRMDNTTAIAYINRMGDTRSQTLSQAACDLWRWCLQQG